MCRRFALYTDPMTLARRFKAEAMTAWPVGARVNSPKNDSPECLEPQGESGGG